MLCSACSLEVTPIVAVDIDGTLGDYHSHFVEFAEGFVGRRLPGGFTGEREFSEHLLLDKYLYRQIKLAYRQGGLKRTMPPVVGGLVMTDFLQDNDVEVWVTTTRPYLRLDGIDPDTREWLRRNGIKYTGLLYDEDKYSVLADRVDPDRVVAVIDDLAEQCRAADTAFGRKLSLLASTTYNCRSEWDGLRTAVGSFDCIAELGERLTKWREEHA